MSDAVRLEELRVERLRLAELREAREERREARKERREARKERREARVAKERREAAILRVTQVYHNTSNAAEKAAIKHALLTLYGFDPDAKAWTTRCKLTKA